MKVILSRRKGPESMSNGVFEVQMHDPHKGQGSLLCWEGGLTGKEAADWIELHPDMSFVVHEHGRATPADHDELLKFQVRTGKRLMRG
jgi:hypothetical protein